MLNRRPFNVCHHCCLNCAFMQLLRPLIRPFDSLRSLRATFSPLRRGEGLVFLFSTFAIQHSTFPVPPRPSALIPRPSFPPRPSALSPRPSFLAARLR